MIAVEINKVKDTRIIRIVGKYRRTPEETLDDITSWKRNIVDKYKDF